MVAVLQLRGRRGRVGEDRIQQQLLCSTVGCREACATSILPHGGTDQQLWSGAIDVDFFAGNALADALAVEAAERAALDLGLIAQVQRVDSHTWRIQKRLLAIAQA